MTATSATPLSLDDPDVFERFLDLVGDGDEYGAIEIVTGLLDSGVPAQRVMLDLIAPTQSRVGELWAANEWSVAREHAATAISERALAAVAARTSVRPTRGRLTVACADGEWHALPGRILAEVLKLDGWRVDFLGANVPGPHLVSHLHRTGPDAVALSCMIPTRLPRAHAAITACRSVGVPVMAGGRGFGPDGRWARTLGADAWEPGAEAAVTRLATDWPPPFNDPDEAAFLGDEEYTYVVRNRATLVQTALDRLHAAYPDASAYDQHQHDATAEDMGHIADFLAAALYVSDQQIFTDFVTWTEAVLQARGVPAAALRTGLHLISDQLRDYPKATATIAAGLAAHP
ncbi:B12-binding domain-containing protein [Actinoplanes sp. N902-109]|uniref:cobalamin B12-binding domain-containing protein n=1 Tax=Actinoplanes sp. (strain N902-109) TaxID=649831 RepID=UPI0003294027|nr:cobalamin-dependent protein [Actinoplanes sp. N902-109]AGL18697.1 cobalamin binding protein-like protein [Actinoplanes sp. N902-109]